MSNSLIGVIGERLAAVECLTSGQEMMPQCPIVAILRVLYVCADHGYYLSVCGSVSGSGSGSGSVSGSGSGSGSGSSSSSSSSSSR